MKLFRVETWNKDAFLSEAVEVVVGLVYCGIHSTKKPVTTMLTYPWKCTVLHCNHLGNTWKPLVLMTRHFDYCLSASEGDNQSVRSSAPVVSRCFPGGYNVKLYISRGRLAWWLLFFCTVILVYIFPHWVYVWCIQNSIRDCIFATEAGSIETQAFKKWVISQQTWWYWVATHIHCNLIHYSIFVLGQHLML